MKVNNKAAESDSGRVTKCMYGFSYDGDALNPSGEFKLVVFRSAGAQGTHYSNLRKTDISCSMCRTMTKIIKYC